MKNMLLCCFKGAGSKSLFQNHPETELHVTNVLNLLWQLVIPDRRINMNWNLEELNILKTTIFKNINLYLIRSYISINAIAPCNCTQRDFTWWNISLLYVVFIQLRSTTRSCQKYIQDTLYSGLTLHCKFSAQTSNASVLLWCSHGFKCYNNLQNKNKLWK